MTKTKVFSATLVNLTPHPINLYGDDDKLIQTIPPSGTVARVAEYRKLDAYVNGIPLREIVFGEIEGLPAPKEGTLYIVSALVRSATKEKGRTDVISPDTGAGAVRDEDGRIIGTRGFVR